MSLDTVPSSQKLKRFPSNGGVVGSTGVAGVGVGPLGTTGSVDAPILSKKNQQTKHLLMNSEEYVSSLWCALLKKPDKGKMKLAQRLREAAAAQMLLDEAAAKEEAELLEVERIAQEERDRFEAQLELEAKAKALLIAQQVAAKEKAIVDAKAAKMAAKAAAAAARLEAAQNKKKKSKSGKLKKGMKKLKALAAFGNIRNNDSSAETGISNDDDGEEENDEEEDVDEVFDVDGEPLGDEVVDPDEIKWFPFSDIPVSREMIQSHLSALSIILLVLLIILLWIGWSDFQNMELLGKITIRKFYN